MSAPLLTNPPRVSQEDRRTASVRPWSVMHATEHVRGVLELAEAQRGLGMRPVLVTPAGYGSIELYLRASAEQERSVSLVSTWQDVRQWRKSLADCAGNSSMDVVHAHCFSAGMSGVRNWPVVVYDLREVVEHEAEAGQQWLARSLRVDEQFVLSRAEAVVVHRPSMRDRAVERGALAEHVFVVPDVVPDLLSDVAAFSDGAQSEDGSWRLRSQLPHHAIIFFAVDPAPDEMETLLGAFAQVAAE